MIRVIIKLIINRFIYFQILLFWAYFEKKEDKYPSPKKNRNDEIEAPTPK